MKKLFAAAVLVLAAFVCHAQQGYIHGNGDPRTTGRDCGQSRFYIDDTTAQMYESGPGSPCVWTVPGNGIPTGWTVTGSGSSQVTTSPGTIKANSLSSCISGICLSFTPSATPGEAVNIDWLNGYIGFLKSLHGQYQVNGADCATDSLPCNYSSSVTPDAGFSICTPIKSGNNWVCEVPTPSSPTALMAAWGAGFLETQMANGATAISGVPGTAVTTTGTPSATGATPTAPAMVDVPTAASSGSFAGWNGQPLAHTAGQPLYKSVINFSASSDYTAARIWMGLCHGCTTSSLNADAPALQMAMIRYSTVAGDATACSGSPCYQCVTDDATTQTVTPMTGAAPGTTIVTVEIDVDASTVVCKVGAVSVTNSTHLPSATSLAWWTGNISTGTAQHIRSAGWYGYYQARNN
jgi:hypothetical protein